MISDGITKLLNTVCRIMKLNFIFIFLTLGGIIFFGLGPATISIIEIYQTYDKKNQSYRLQNIIDIYKRNFVRGNALFVTHLGVIGLLVWNLYLATQIKIWFVAIYIIFLIVILTFATIFTFYSYYVAALYELSYQDNLKVASYLFFSNIFVILKMIGAILIVMLISYEYKGLFLFISFGLMTMITNKLLYPLYFEFDKKLEGAYEKF